MEKNVLFTSFPCAFDENLYLHRRHTKESDYTLYLHQREGRWSKVDMKILAG